MLLSERDRNQPDTLDTHPMVRDHFRHRLKAQSAAWIAGHYRLYKHFTRKAKVFPDTVEEMTLLYDAIMHGCEAGRFQEVLEKVYIPRVSRREAFFSKRKLGSWSADLAALSHFFVVPWDQPVASLKTNYSAFILGEVGWALQAIGRMHEAASPTSAALEARLALSDWFNASATATNLSLIYQNLGDLVQAHYYATESVQFAVRSGFAFSRLIGKARLANTLHQMGRLPEAETLFDEAKTLIQTAEPRYPHLYSLWFYYYSTLLLDQRKYAEVEEIAVRELHSATVRDVVLDIALAYLALGHCQLLQFLEGQPGHVNEATANLIQATDKLRQAGVIEFKSLGLLIQAGLYRAKREFDHARANLDEVMTDTTISNLALQQADCHLEYAQLYLAQGESEKAGEHFNEGKKLIERIGYYRRTNNVEALGKQLNCFR
jgi:tetratricopeptide (TPR) repeat protein